MVHIAPVAHLLGVVITSVFLLAGCHAFTLSDRQTLPSGGWSYAALRPFVGAETAGGRSGQSRSGQFCCQQQQVRCVDLYYQAAILAWQQLELGDNAAVQTYQDSVARMLAAASRYGRLDPRSRLMIVTAHGNQVVPITYYGFAWRPTDFCQVLPAAEFNHHDLRHHYATRGIGASLVAVRQACYDEEFFHRRQTFPATAVLRPTHNGAVLEFHNPLEFDSLSVGPNMLPLDRDLTASLAYLETTTPRKYLEGFLDPGETDVKPTLVMMEPYQPGKIPVVFIHGLGSDPLNLGRRHQQSAGARRHLSPLPVLVLSLSNRGRLAAIGRRIARETAHRPGDVRPPAWRPGVCARWSLSGIAWAGWWPNSRSVTRTIFFGSMPHNGRWRRSARQTCARNCVTLSTSIPSPLVKRVIFMATPHGGSNMARRLVGRVASKFVHYPPDEEAAYRQLMDDNRDVFREYLWKKKLTTIDLLEPDNPLLKAMARMPISRCVRWHSIIGTRVTLPGIDPSDGVVPVFSARLAGAAVNDLFPRGTKWSTKSMKASQS